MAPDKFLVTDGAGELRKAGSVGHFRSGSAVLRATWEGSDGNSSGLRFTYLGQSDEAVPLSDGEMRTQIGLKLRSEDDCNVVYVMWHLSPDQIVEVSVKTNPGVHNSEECDDAGYQFLEPEKSEGAPAPIKPGKQRSIEAAIEGDRIKVWVDGKLNWVGKLPEEATVLQGSAGIRADNMKVVLVPTRVLASAASQK